MGKSLLRLNMRSRRETVDGGGSWKAVTETKEMPVEEVAVLLCDMWDRHWCVEATERAGALASRMNPVLKAIRTSGIRVIHSPSNTLDFYEGTPQRKRMTAIRTVQPSEPVEPSPEPPPLIQNTVVRCRICGRRPSHVWTRQHPALDIGEEDLISDDGVEVYSFLQHAGVRLLAIMGIHTNFCVLNRPFGIKQMTKWGVPCVLVRDLTDAYFDPGRPPYVSRDRGTELTIEYVEKYWCPSITSDDLAGVHTATSSRTTGKT